MKRSFTLIGATTAGFAGVIVLHGPASQAASIKRTSPATTAAPAKSGPSTAPTTTAAPSAPVNGTAVGPQENYGYGQMSVKVTITNNRIVDVSVSSIQALEAYSLQLEQQVVPMLKSEVLAAQGTNINSISGATYTSEAYAYSLQGALDQLHFK